MSWIKDGLVALGGWQILFTMLNTLILYLGLKHFLFEPVKKMMDERTASIEEQIAAANEKQQLAEENLLQSEKQIKSVKEEGREIVREARRNAQEQYDEIVRSAKQEAQDIRRKNEAEIIRDKSKVMDGMKNEIAEMVIMVAEKVIRKNMTEQTQEQLIDEFIHDVGDTEWEN